MKLIFWACVAVLFAVVAGPARAELSLTWYTVDGGGHTFSAGGDLLLGGTAGQPDAGQSTGATLILAGGFWCGGSGTPSAAPEDADPTAFRILAGLVNPFRHETGVLLELPQPQLVDVSVFDLCGRVVRRLHEGTLPVGRHHLRWDGTSDTGQHLGSGVYILRVQAGHRLIKRRVVLIR